MLPYRADTVLDPSSSTMLVARSVGPCDGKEVLIVGSGAGLLAITAARAGGKVTASDIAPSAVELTRRNAEACGVSVVGKACDFRECTNAGGSWDVIVSNPPQQPSMPLSEIRSWYEHSHYGGMLGLEFICDLLRFAGSQLAPSGRLICSIFDFLRDDVWQECARSSGLAWTLAASVRHLKGKVTCDSMSRYPDSYRDGALDTSYYMIRVFVFGRLQS
jgi:methylase of polypeptide subunit release factors